MQALMLEKRYLPQIKNIDEKIFRVIFVEKNPKFITKKNTLSKCKGDADRYLKFAIDAVAKQTGFNDSQIVSIACEQVQSEDDHYYLAVFLSYGDFKAEKSES